MAGLDGLEDEFPAYNDLEEFGLDGLVGVDEDSFTFDGGDGSTAVREIQPTEDFKRMNLSAIIRATQATRTAARKVWPVKRKLAADAAQGGAGKQAKKQRHLSPPRSRKPLNLSAAECESFAPVYDEDLPKIVNLMSKKKTRAANPWSVEDTKRLYKCLSMFGPMPSAIAKMFPGRTAEEIAKKYSQERKVNNKRVAHALANRRPIDVAVYEKYKKLSERVQREAEAAALAVEQAGQAGADELLMGYRPEDTFEGSEVDLGTTQPAVAADPRLTSVVADTVGPADDAWGFNDDVGDGFSGFDADADWGI